MKTLFLPLLSLVSGVAAESVQLSPPKRAVWELALSSQTESLNKEQLIKLAELFPKFFGFHFVCQFKSSAQGATPTALIPGDVADAPEGGSITCPGNYNLTLEKKSRVRVFQAEKIPRFVLQTGQINLNLGKAPVFLETNQMQIAALGLGQSQHLVLSAIDKEESFHCNEGNLTLNLFTNELDQSKKFLSSKSCRMEVALNGGAIKRYVSGEDKVLAENLVLPYRLWPRQGIVPALKPPPSSALASQIQLTFSPASEPNAPFTVQWHTSGLEPGANCIVYLQKKDVEAQVEFSHMAMNTPTGDFKVDASNHNGLISMICEKAELTLASNAIALDVPRTTSGTSF